MAEIATQYRQAVIALHGSAVGWCAVAAEHNAAPPLGAAMWELVSAAYLMNGLKSQVQTTSYQRSALQHVLSRVPGMVMPPQAGGTSTPPSTSGLALWLRKTLAGLLLLDTATG